MSGPIQSYSLGQIHRSDVNLPTNPAELRAKIKTDANGSKYIHIYQRKNSPDVFDSVRYALEDIFGKSKPAKNLIQSLETEGKINSGLKDHLLSKIDNKPQDLVEPNSYYKRTQPRKFTLSDTEYSISPTHENYTRYKNLLDKVSLFQKQNRKPFLTHAEFDFLTTSLQAATDQLKKIQQESPNSPSAEVDKRKIASFEILLSELNECNKNPPDPAHLKSEISIHIKNHQKFHPLVNYRLNSANTLLHRYINNSLNRSLTDNETILLNELLEFIKINENTIPKILSDAAIKYISGAIQEMYNNYADLTIESYFPKHFSEEKIDYIKRNIDEKIQSKLDSLSLQRKECQKLTGRIVNNRNGFLQEDPRWTDREREIAKTMKSLLEECISKNGGNDEVTAATTYFKEALVNKLSEIRRTLAYSKK